MDEQNERTDKISQVGTFSITTTEDYPVQFDQYLSEAPSGIKSSVKVQRTQLTQKSALKSINRSAVIGSYDINLPKKEPCLRIASVYRPMYEKAFNYDRTHYDAFFDAYPELWLGSGDRPSTQELKANVKQWVKRAAHMIYYYELACSKMVAAYANMVTLTRYDGSVPFKDIATHFRWSRLNSISGKLARWYWPRGLFDFVTKIMCYAVGRTTYGSDIVLFPHIVTDVFGSRGAQAPDFSNLFSFDTTDEDKRIVGGNFGANLNISEYMRNCYAIYSQFGDAYNGRITPNGYYIENGQTIVMAHEEEQPGGGGVISPETFFQNRHGVGPHYHCNTKLDFKAEPNGDRNCWDNLLDSYYAAFRFWEDYLNENFPVFADPNSDFVVFFTKEIALLEQGHTGLEMLNIIRNNKNIELTDLLAIKSYKACNQPTTASWISDSLPIFVDPDGADIKAKYGARGDPWSNDASLEVNLERYEVDSMYPGDIIEDAKLWPSNTPNTFDAPEETPHSGTAPLTRHPYPYVPGAISSFGEHTQWDENMTQPNVGKYASWFDRCCSSSMAPEDTYVEGIGISAKTLEDYVKAGGGIVFEENNTKVFVPEFPVFDNSDPYQCGVNVMITAQHTDNEWEKYFGDISNFFGQPNESAGPIVYPCVQDGQGKDATFHTEDARYVRQIGHAFIFVGMGILHHPLMTYGLKNSGNPVTTWDITDYTEGEDISEQYSYIKQVAALWNTDNQLKMINDIIDHAGAWYKLGATTTNPGASARFKNAILQMGGEAHGYHTWYNFMFNPTYGNIALSIAVNPMDEISDALPPIYSDSADYVQAQDPAYYGSVKVNQSSGNTFGLPGTLEVLPNTLGTRSLDVSSKTFGTSLRTKLAGFIDNFKYRQSRYSNHLLHPTSLDVGSVHFGGIANWVCSLMSRSMAQFLGIEDIKPIWSSDVMHDTSGMQGHAMVKQTAAMPENPIVAEARVPNSINKDKRSFTHQANKRSDPPKNPRNYTKDVGSSSSSDGNPNEVKKHSSKRHRSRGKSKYGEKMDSGNEISYNRDGLAKQDDVGTIPGTPPDKPRKDPHGPFDKAAAIM